MASSAFSSSVRTRSATSNASISESMRRRTHSRSRSTAVTNCRRGCLGNWATSCSARRWSATPGVLRSCTPSCTSSAMTTARRWKRGSGLTHEDSPVRDRELQLRDRRRDSRVADAAQHADPLRGGRGRDRRCRRGGRLEDRAQRLVDLDRVRPGGRDDQHRVEGAIDAATTSFDPMAKLAKDIAAGAVLIASVNAVAVGYLVFAGKAADKTAGSSTGFVMRPHRSRWLRSC